MSRGSLTQAVASGLLDIGLSAPLAGLAGVLLLVLGPVLGSLLLLGGLEALAQRWRRGKVVRWRIGSDGGQVPGTAGCKGAIQRGNMTGCKGAIQRGNMTGCKGAIQRGATRGG